MNLTNSRLQAMKAALSQIRSGARALTELLDEIEPSHRCDLCHDSGFIESVSATGERASAFCTCPKGRGFREDSKVVGRDRAAGKD